MTTAGSRWGVVMSRNAGFSDQVSAPTNLWTVGFCYFCFWYNHLFLSSEIFSFILLVLYETDTQGRGAWFFVPKWRYSPQMGKWLQDNMHGSNCRSGCIHIKHTETQIDGWNSRNSPYVCISQHACEGTDNLIYLTARRFIIAGLGNWLGLSYLWYSWTLSFVHQTIIDHMKMENAYPKLNTHA